MNVLRMPHITVASLSDRGWSGPLERHICRSRKAGSGRREMEYKTLAVFCLVMEDILLEYQIETGASQRGNPHKTLQLLNFLAV